MPSGKRSSFLRPLQFIKTLRRSAVSQAEQLMNEGNVLEAGDVLDEHLQQTPDDVEALEMRAAVAAMAGSVTRLWQINDKLCELLPENEDYLYRLMELTLSLGMLFTTRQAIERYQERFPSGKSARNVRKIREAVEKAIASNLKRDPILSAAGPDDLRLFEKARVLVEGGQYAEGRRLAQQVADRIPGFVSPRNNVTLSYLVEGEFDKAIANARATLVDFPGNIHALSNLVQALVRTGRTDEAQQTADALLAVVPEDGSLWHKQLEALAFAGDDAALRGHYEKYARAKIARDSPPQVYHMAAVAYARQGDEKQAKSLWRRALRENPEFEPALDNLGDLQERPGEHSGAWYFSMPHWIAGDWSEELGQIAERKNPEAGLEKFAAQQPYFITALKILLERGDPIGREFALTLAIQLKLPLLKDFALSANGSDSARVRALTAAKEYGFIPADAPVPAWMQGKQMDVIPLEFEIYFEPVTTGLSDEIQDKIADIHDLLLNGKNAQALKEVEKALKLAPDVPTLMNYHATALNALGQKAAYKRVVAETRKKHPDYFFGISAMIDILISENKLAEARQLVIPLQQRGRYHVSEYAALAKANFDLLLAEKHTEQAEMWYEMAEQMLEDHPVLDYMENRLMPHLLIQRFQQMTYRQRPKRKKKK